jgi:hypothetical protein
MNIYNNTALTIFYSRISHIKNKLIVTNIDKGYNEFNLMKTSIFIK